MPGIAQGNAFVLSSRTMNCKRDAGSCGWLSKHHLTPTTPVG